MEPNEQGCKRLLNFTRTDTSQTRMFYLRFPLEQSLMSGSACVTVDFYLYDACRSVCTTHFCAIIIFTLRTLLHSTLLYSILYFIYSSFFLVYLFAYFVCVTLNCFTPPFLSNRESFCFHHRRRELCGRTNASIASNIRTLFSARVMVRRKCHGAVNK